jgi:hypothetical protein
VNDLFGDLIERIDRRRRQVRGRSVGDRVRADIEDLLTEGYITALTAESRSRELARRLEALADAVEDEDAAREARRLALEKRALDRRVGELRARLRELRESLQSMTASRSARP